ncbi:hypothetical protein ACMX2I_18285 [Bacillus sp. SW14]|uniref:hypothetical protein n=1 Tax=Bacillus sp. SW14 TaxID=3391618 RepID=UPI0039E4DF5A
MKQRQWIKDRDAAADQHKEEESGFIRTRQQSDGIEKADERALLRAGKYVYGLNEGPVPERICVADIALFVDKGVMFYKRGKRIWY